MNAIKSALRQTVDAFNAVEKDTQLSARTIAGTLNFTVISFLPG